MTTAFVLDTCVISETALPRPREPVIRFLATAEKYFIPAGALMELQLGITKVCATNPIKAVKLSAWYHELVRAGIPIIETDREVSETWGVLSADPRLQGLCQSGRKAIRGGQDLHIAAAALVRRLPIATMNVTDFMLIHECYPLPGVYDPLESRWHTRMEPLADQYPLSPANKDEENRLPVRHFAGSTMV
ncbi:putative nucleic acid-binding protein [Rhizobium leguminosarum bv. trifolii WSM2297]|uniref:Putative nucleic acid-binding protein n=1 Tax=Rhizobium leguminosarum bv. trifolii WSM2297 TaxID=754762 RepID=J0CCC8_RHILT|nr:type II toxin-antitoxin system VapC family toxin [Rhizobium leguminosarum]EJC80807.1 putative nucleic acid-binding protein [Rhizobium leguminosarum bv. trifolii WSM2297]